MVILSPPATEASMGSEGHSGTYLQTNKQATILVEGYTCNLGSDKLNQKLSELRADAVKKVLVEAGVPSDKIETK